MLVVHSTYEDWITDNRCFANQQRVVQATPGVQTMKTAPPPIDVRRYDAIVELLQSSPDLEFAEVARQSGVTENTVRKIWEGAISRPQAVVLERLTKPRRCRDCGALCCEWPCVLCSIRRRNTPRGETRMPTRFVYKRQSK